MAGSRIEYDDIFDPNILNKFVKGFETAEKEIKKSLKQIQNEAKKLDFNSGNSKTFTESLSKLNQLSSESKEKLSQLNAVQKELSKTKSRLATVSSKEYKEIQQVNQATQQHTRIAKLDAKIANSQAGSYDHVSASLSKAKIQWKAMTPEQRKATEQGKLLTQQIKAQTRELKKLDARFGVFGRNVGNYKSAIGGLTKVLGAFGVFLGGAMIVRGFKQIITLGSQFEKQMSKVRAITGASGQEFQALQRNAQRLGESTEKTASQVAELQVELAKLGLSASQIIGVTEAILDLSTASDSDLAQSAKVSASVMKQFNLTAKDMTRITDVMALSFSSSALDLNKFEVAMAVAGPVIYNTGKSVEFATAQLSVLVDRGLDASTAGTSLRNIFLEISKRGLTLEEALLQVNQATDKNVKALELFGKRGATAGVILAQNQDEAKRLEEAYNNSAGSAKRMADIMRDNLAGDADKAKSALQGLSLNIMNALTPSLRSVTQGFTDFVSGINKLITGGHELSQSLERERSEITQLITMITTANISQKNRADLIQELNLKYPELLKNLNKEKVTNEELQALLLDVNEQYKIKIANAIKKEELADVQNRLTDLYRYERKELKLLAQAKERNNMWDQRNGIPTYEQNIALNKEKIKLLEEEMKVREEEIDSWVEASVLTKTTNDESKKYVETLAELKQQLADLKEARDLIATSDEEGLRLNAKEIEDIEKLIAKYEQLGMSLTKVQIKEQERNATKKQKGDDKLIKTFEVSMYDEAEDPYNEAEQTRGDTEYYMEQWRSSYEGRRAMLDAMLNADQIGEREHADLVKELDQEVINNKMQLYMSYVQQAQELADALYGFQQNRYQKELDDIRRLRENELKMAGDNQAKIDAINEKYDRKEAESKTKQARSDKGKAIFDSIIKTALAVMQASTLGPPLMFPFMALAGAIGAIQTAVIASQPIPQFEKGVRSKPESGWAIVGEGGKKEMIIDPQGNVSFTGEGTEMRYLEKGTEVVANKDLQHRLALMQMSDRHMKLYDDKLSTRKLEDLQRSHIRTSQKTNELLSKFRFTEGQTTYDLQGNKVTKV